MGMATNSKDWESYAENTTVTKDEAEKQPQVETVKSIESEVK